MYSFIKYIFCKHSLHWNTKNKTHTIFSNRIFYISFLDNLLNGITPIWKFT